MSNRQSIKTKLKVLAQAGCMQMLCDYGRLCDQYLSDQELDGTDEEYALFTQARVEELKRLYKAQLKPEDVISKQIDLVDTINEIRKEEALKQQL